MSSDLVAKVQLQPANPPKGHVLAHSGLLSSMLYIQDDNFTDSEVFKAIPLSKSEVFNTT